MNWYTPLAVLEAFFITGFKPDSALAIFKARAPSTLNFSAYQSMSPGISEGFIFSCIET